MRSVVMSGIFLVGCACFAVAAQAQTVKKNLAGLIISKAVDVPANAAMVVFTTPAATAPGTGFFVLTQFCGPQPEVELSAAGLGPIHGGADDCTTYTPGVAIPQAAAITCTNLAPATRPCTITGVLTKN